MGTACCTMDQPILLPRSQRRVTSQSTASPWRSNDASQTHAFPWNRTGVFVNPISTQQRTTVRSPDSECAQHYDNHSHALFELIQRPSSPSVVSLASHRSVSAAVVITNPSTAHDAMPPPNSTLCVGLHDATPQPNSTLCVGLHACQLQTSDPAAVSRVGIGFDSSSHSGDNVTEHHMHIHSSGWRPPSHRTSGPEKRTKVTLVQVVPM